MSLVSLEDNYGDELFYSKLKVEVNVKYLIIEFKEFVNNNSKNLFNIKVRTITKLNIWYWISNNLQTYFVKLYNKYW